MGCLCLFENLLFVVFNVQCKSRECFKCLSLSFDCCSLFGIFKWSSTLRPSIFVSYKVLFNKSVCVCNLKSQMLFWRDRAVILLGLFISWDYDFSSRNNFRICSWSKIEINLFMDYFQSSCFCGIVQVPLICCFKSNNVKICSWSKIKIKICSWINFQSSLFFESFFLNVGFRKLLSFFAGLFRSLSLLFQVE